MANFYDRFRDAAERFPSNVAVELQRQSGGSERHSYAELRQQAEAVGRYLSRAEPGRRCAILANNGPRWVAAYLGVLASGNVAVPFDTAFKTEQIAKLLKDCGATVLFVDARHLAAAEPAAQQAAAAIVMLDRELPVSSAAGRIQALKHEPGGAEYPQFDDMAKAAPEAAFQPAALTAEDTAVILYTSGTTSDPKGVMLTHGNLIAESEAVFQFIRIAADDSLLGILPLFHALAQMANLLLPLAVGARVVFLDSLNTTELMRALAERDITLFACVPQFFYLIHERILHRVQQRGAAALVMFGWLKQLCFAARKLRLNPGKRLFREAHQALGPRMRYLVTGGSRFDPVIARDLYAMGFDILQAYGLTETSGGATCTPPGRNVLGSVGQPLPGNQVKIVNPELQAEGPPVGEIAINGGIVMKGYYNRPDATAEVLRDGWLYTGDLGYRDDGGNVFVTGRRKDVIVLSSGKNIYPEEIEAHYQRSPFIKEIAVMGLRSRPGEPFSERLHAVIVPDFEALRARRIVNAGEVVRFDVESLSAQTPSTKRILSYELWQHELPRTTTRKLKRFAIQQEVERRRETGAGSDATTTPAREFTDADLIWLEQADVTRAMAVIRGTAKIKKPQYHPDDSLELDLGLDSMERVELLVALEEALEAHAEDNVVSGVYTIRELIEAVRAARGAAAREPAGWDTVLAADPAPEDVRDFQRRRWFGAPFWYLVGRAANLFARIFFRLEVSGRENLPRSGAYLLCPNHQSFLDAPILAAVLPWRVFERMFTVGTSEIFGAGLFRALARSFRLFPVDPDANLVPAMRIGAYGLRHGMVLLLYPEGERSMTGEPRRFKKGAAILATHLNVPIVPVAQEGFFEAWPRGESFQQFAKLRIRFGKPVMPIAGATPEASYEATIAEVRSRVVEMWRELHDSRGGKVAAD